MNLIVHVVYFSVEAEIIKEKDINSMISNSENKITVMKWYDAYGA